MPSNETHEMSRRIIAEQTGNPRYDHGLQTREPIPLGVFVIAAFIALVISLCWGAV